MECLVTKNESTFKINDLLYITLQNSVIF